LDSSWNRSVSSGQLTASVPRLACRARRFAPGAFPHRPKATLMRRSRVSAASPPSPGRRGRSRRASEEESVCRKHVFKFVVSLGSVCFTARFLDGLELRKFKLPFDWLYSSARMVRHVLHDDFRTFLDRSQYFRAGGRGHAQPPSKRQRTSSTASSDSGVGGIGHRIYSRMVPSPQRRVVWPHHDLMHREGADYDSFKRAVKRFRRVFGESNGRRLFVLTHLVKSEQELDAIRNTKITTSSAPGPPPVPKDHGGPELACVDEVRQLFKELQTYASGDLGSFHLEAVYLVLPPASEAAVRPSSRCILTCRTGRASLSVHELHCIGGNTGLFFKEDSDNNAFRRLLEAGRRFDPIAIDDTWPQGYSDNIRAAVSSSKRKTAPKAMLKAARLRSRSVAGKAMRSRSRKRRAGATKVLPSQRIRVQRDNPKTPGSAAHSRYEAYKSAKTVGEFFRLGAARGDLKHDSEKGFLKMLS